MKSGNNMYSLANKLFCFSNTQEVKDYFNKGEEKKPLKEKEINVRLEKERIYKQESKLICEIGKPICKRNSENVFVKILPFGGQEKKSKIREIIEKYEKKSEPEKRKKEEPKLFKAKNIFPDDKTIYNKLLVINALNNVLKNEASDSCVKVSRVIKKEKVSEIDYKKGMKFMSMQCYDMGYVFNANKFMESRN